MKKSPIKVNRSPVRLVADPKRVITRLFLPGDEERIRGIVDRVRSLTDEEVKSLLAKVVARFSSRHKDIRRVFRTNYERIPMRRDEREAVSQERRLLIGSYFTMEYSLESVALFNPSIVLHPDQNGLTDGTARFIMSLRACGEGHISSIVFRTGRIDPANGIVLDALTPYAARERPVEDTLYDKHPFFLKLIEMGVYNDIATMILEELPGHFTLYDLEHTVQARRRTHGHLETYEQTAESMLWLAQSNYHLDFPPDTKMSERVIFPVTENESRGIEDARFVRFTYDDGKIVYYATYAAYNGFRSLPQFIETEDFTHFKIVTLNGRYAQNKGMALFPRQIDGLYMMIARVDGESLFLLPSDNRHFWNEMEKLHGPTQPWEFMQIGNCGSPIETQAGWLLLTHGVGPMRTYCLGVTLLDLDDPSRVIGQLKEPILMPTEEERDGYVPNVVYSCGAMIHQDQLIIPYAMSDSRTGIATVSVPDLLSHLTG